MSSGGSNDVKEAALYRSQTMPRSRCRQNARDGLERLATDSGSRHRPYGTTMNSTTRFGANINYIASATLLSIRG